MNYVVVALQIIVSISILNVWLLRYNQPTKWRGGNAQNIFEEFRAYGLPEWTCYAVGTMKVLLAGLLLLAIWFPPLRQLAAIGLAVMLLGSIAMHIKIKDPMIKSLPAATFFILCLLIAYFG